MTDDDPYDVLKQDYLDRDDVSEGRMMSSRGLKVRGRFICFRGADEMVFKLPPARVEELVARGLERFSVSGRRSPMKEWVVSPISDVAEWPGLLAEAYERRAAEAD